MTEPIESPEPWERSGSWAFQLALCLLSPLFFVSYLLTILAPLPSLYLLAGNPRRNQGRFWWAISLVVGSAIATFIHGWYLGGAAFAIFAALPALALGEVLLAKKGPERAVMAALFTVLAGIAASLVVTAVTQHKSVGSITMEGVQATEQWFRNQAQEALNRSGVQWSEENKAALQKIQEDPSIALPDLPGLAIAAALLLCILPCLAMIRWNPKGFLQRAGIGRDFLRKWRSPEWLVWPAILCLALTLLEVKHLEAVARNFVKPLVLIYFFQGMSILAYFLDSIRLRGPLRVPVYVLGLAFMPMVVSFGFFDLWLNFRRRHRSGEAEEERES